MFETFSILILVLFGIFIALSIWTIKRKSYLLLIISIVTAIAISLPFCVIHFGPSVWMYYELKNLQTTFSKDGVCKQTTGFTCGPAATVTVLRLLGIEAQESELAIYSKCTPEGGTTNENLVNAIEKLYGKKGIECSYLPFDSIDQLKGKCPLIACLNLSSAVSHYTVVLEITDDKVIIGDPIGGKKQWSYEDFKKRCWPTAIVLKNNQLTNPPN
jgi:predicted double-glycine peptidase